MDGPGEYHFPDPTSKGAGGCYGNGACLVKENNAVISATPSFFERGESVVCQNLTTENPTYNGRSGRIIKADGALKRQIRLSSGEEIWVSTDSLRTNLRLGDLVRGTIVRQDSKASSSFVQAVAYDLFFP